MGVAVEWMAEAASAGPPRRIRGRMLAWSHHPLSVVRELLGHAHITATQRYVHLEVEDLRQ